MAVRSHKGTADRRRTVFLRKSAFQDEVAFCSSKAHLREAPNTERRSRAYPLTESIPAHLHALIIGGFVCYEFAVYWL